jgi:hypothetical protein
VIAECPCAGASRAVAPQRALRQHAFEQAAAPTLRRTLTTALQGRRIRDPSLARRDPLRYVTLVSIFDRLAPMASKDIQASEGADPVAELPEMFVDPLMGRCIAKGQVPAVRPVFIKTHGVAAGTFRIRTALPLDMAVAVFGHDAFPAVVRHSSDTIPTALDEGTTLGIAITLFEVPGDKLLHREFAALAIPWTPASTESAHAPSPSPAQMGFRRVRMAGRGSAYRECPAASQEIPRCSGACFVGMALRAMFPTDPYSRRTDRGGARSSAGTVPVAWQKDQPC